MRIFIINILILLFSTLLSLPGFTQTFVTGKVVDVEGKALPGVSVIELNTYSETITDIDGEFRIQVTGSSSLKITYVGYKEKVIQTGNTYYFLIELEESPKIEEHWYYLKSFSIGYFGDFNYLPWGISIAHLRPYTRLPFIDRSKFLSGEINFKTNSHSDYDINLSLKWHHVYQSRNYCLDIKSLYHERKLEINEADLVNKDFQLIFVNTINKSFSVSPGLIKREDRYMNSVSLLGYHFSTRKYISKFKQEFSGHINYFGNYSEFGFAFNQDLSKLFSIWNGFYLGLAFNSYRRYNEVNLLLKYVKYY